MKTINQSNVCVYLVFRANSTPPIMSPVRLITSQLLTSHTYQCSLPVRYTHVYTGLHSGGSVREVREYTGVFNELCLWKAIQMGLLAMRIPHRCILKLNCFAFLATHRDIYLCAHRANAMGKELFGLWWNSIFLAPLDKSSGWQIRIAVYCFKWFLGYSSMEICWNMWNKKGLSKL